MKKRSDMKERGVQEPMALILTVGTHTYALMNIYVFGNLPIHQMQDPSVYTRLAFFLLARI